MRIGVDLGGTKIELLAMADDGRELFRKRVATPKHYQGTVNAIVALVNEAEDYLGGMASVGVGIPGTISPYTGLVKNANSTWLNGKPFDRDLSHALRREVRLANDANCFTISEAIDGAGAAYGLVLGVILGTGCGAGLAIRGRLHQGANAVGGEWGHNPLPWMRAEEFHSTQCFCGRQDCIETFISGSGFVADYIAGGGQALSGEQIMTWVALGDPLANQVFERYLDRLARALAQVINILDPDAVVLGGGMSNVNALYTRVPSMLPKYVLGGECRTPLLKNRHGCSSGVRGAAWLWDCQ